MISTKRIIVIFLFLSIKIFPQSSFSEKESIKIDSLIKKNQWCLVHLKLLNENLKFKRISKYSLQYHLLIKLDSASVLYKQGKYLEAKKAVLFSLDQVEIDKNNLSVLQYEGLKHIGITRLFYIEKRLGDISQGLKYLNTFSQGMSAIYKKKQIIFYAVAHAELGNYKKSIELLNRHLKDIYSDSKNFLYRGFSKNEEIASTYNTTGDTFIKWYKDTGNEKLLDSAHHHYEHAYRIMKNLPDFCVYSKALFMCRQANIKLLKKQYENSLLLYNACEKDSVLMDKNFSRETVWLGKAEVYTFLKKPDSAFYYINKIFNEKLPAKCTYENKLKIYHLLSINYENRNDNKNAYKFAKLSLAEINKKNIRAHSGNNALGAYEKSEIKYASEETIKKNSENTFLLILFITFLFISAVFYMKYHYNKRKNRIFVEFQKKIEEKGSVPVQLVPLEMHENVTIIIEDKLVDRILKNLDMLESKKKFLSNNFKLAGIAKQLDTNTAYLSKIINERKGMSFSEYVNDLRINYLLVELQHNPTFRKYTIQAISEEIGYKSTTTFIKAFKDRIQMTPSEYIKNLNNS